MDRTTDEIWQIYRPQEGSKPDRGVMETAEATGSKGTILRDSIAGTEDAAFTRR